MTGIEQYNNVQERRIYKILDQCPYLSGYYAFISTNCQLTTAYNYLNQVKRFHLNNGKLPEELTFSDFSMYMLHSKKTQTGKMVENTTIVGIYHALEWYGKYLVASGILKEDPMKYINRPRGKESIATKTKREKSYLTKEEVGELISNVKNGIGSSQAKARQAKWKERDYAIIILFLTTGFRCSALYKMDIDNLDLENNKIVVTDKGGYVKEYDLSQIATEALQDWLAIREKMNIVNEKALFISCSKTRMSNTSIANIIKKYGSSIIKNTDRKMSPHKLRATYGTQLYEATKDIYFVQQCMGHSSPTTTELYVRGNANKSGQAASIMSNIIKFN